VTAPPSPEAPDGPYLRPILLWGLLALVLLGVFGTAVVAFLAPRLVGGRHAVSDLPDYGEAPTFSLTTHRGATLSSADLAGRPWIAEFVFTRCTAVCPVMSLRTAELDKNLPPSYSLVSISVDPEHDTPEVLADYAARYEPSARWHFATGDGDAIEALSVQGFKLGLDRAPPPDQVDPAVPIIHSSRLVLVDGEGRIRGYYDALDSEAMGRLKKDAATFPTH
jgi:protein SCO1